MIYVIIEGNRVYDNEKYRIDPHSGTHILIKNNIIYDNYIVGIIRSEGVQNNSSPSITFIDIIL